MAVWVTERAEFPFCSLLSNLIFKGACYRWENWKVKRGCLCVEHLQLFPLPIWTQHHFVLPLSLNLGWYRKECHVRLAEDYKALCWCIIGSVHLNASSLLQVQCLQDLTLEKSISSAFTTDISRRHRLISGLTCQGTEKSHWHSRCT